MADWAKLHGKISESEDFTAVLNESPLAASLFLMGLPKAAPWGVLPGTAFAFKAKVCPMAQASLDEIQTALRLLEDHSMLTAYTGRNGKPLVYYSAWNDHQDRQWGARRSP